ncbi:hypothetical protein V8E51_011086 [Hyaloscypha variabilis]
MTWKQSTNAGEESSISSGDAHYQRWVGLIGQSTMGSRRKRDLGRAKLARGRASGGEERKGSNLGKLATDTLDLHPANLDRWDKGENLANRFRVAWKEMSEHKRQFKDARPAGWNPRRFPHPWATLWDASAALLYLRRRVVEAPSSSAPIQEPEAEKCIHRRGHCRTKPTQGQAVDRRPLRAAAATGAEQRLKTNLPLSTVEVQDLFLFCGALVSALFGVLH